MPIGFIVPFLAEMVGCTIGEKIRNRQSTTAWGGRFAVTGQGEGPSQSEARLKAEENARRNVKGSCGDSYASISPKGAPQVVQQPSLWFVRQEFDVTCVPR